LASHRKFNVLMVGTDLSTMGGISSVIRNYFESGLIQRLGVSYIPTHKDGTRFAKAWFYLKQIPLIIANMPRVRIVHIHTSQGWSFRRLLLIFWIARLFARKTVWHVHGSQFDNYYDGAAMIEKYLIRQALRGADLVVALSTGWKDKLSEIEPKSNISVIHNAVNTSKYHVIRSRRHDPAVVLFLGRLGKRKGIYDLLEAAALLKSENIRFVLAGDGDIEQVNQHIANHGLASNVSVLGWVSPDKVVALLRDADIYALPSYDEGLPMGILEAMSAGLPVVTTPIGGIPEAVADNDNGFLVRPGDCAGLAERLKRLASDQQLWMRMSESSLRRAEQQFGMEKAEQELGSNYSDLLQGVKRFA
jgi:glycosyltransferase involved in cell wall biosynthesis